MELAELQKHWEAFGETDPLWAILSSHGKRYGRWSLDEFFREGRNQIAGLIRDLAVRNLNVARGRVLDFGCGVGRLTQALAEYFEECQGVDISASMIQRAQEYNRYGDRCSYVLNERDDLSVFENDRFDLVYSSIVLQHMQPKYSRNYIQEFIRVVKPGGIVVFQIPSGPQPALGATSRPQTMTTGPMPDSAFRAELTPVEWPDVMVAGSRARLVMRIKNVSNDHWPSLGTPEGKFWLTLGNHWFHEDGQSPIMDDGRMRLPHDLAPGEEIELPLEIKAPDRPGPYQLELDLGQEWVTWFKSKGSATAILNVQVQPTSNGEAFHPEIEMYFVPKEDVVDLITQCGGKVVDIQRVNANDGLLDFNYYVAK